DRQELADYLEVDRSGLSSEISKLRKEGILECKKNRFTLLRQDN
ncbi:MAG: helix-turn-helix domain-containing protein, partial [Lachnospiraceae bacterium]|nr:helix-turn-helix domain-containing protein [Lachnospiraceae bacterium]